MEIVRKKDSNEKGPEPGTGGVEIVRTMEVKTPERRSSGYSHFFGSKFVRITHSLQSRFFNFGKGDNLIDLENIIVYLLIPTTTRSEKDASLFYYGT
jgi:hypothetical protein